MYIGKYEIESTKHVDETFVEVTLKDHVSVKLHETLLDLVSSEKPLENAEVTDAVTHVLAAKFCGELGKYNLDFYMARMIGEKMGILCHNLREQLLSKTFNCSGGDQIPLKTVIDFL